MVTAAFVFLFSVPEEMGSFWRQGTTSLVSVYLTEVGPTHAGREQSSRVKGFTENLK